MANDVFYGTPVVGEYAVNKVQEGYRKGLHMFKKFNVSETDIVRDIVKGTSEYADEYNEKIENDKKQVQEIIKHNDDFYIQNKDELQGIPYLLGGMAESIANPYEMALNLGTSSLTGGAGIALKLSSQIFADTISLKTQAESIENREPTLKEYAANAALNSLPDIAGYYIASKAKFSNNIELGDSKIDIRSLKEAFDDDGLYDGATKVAYQTQQGVTFDTDVVDVKNINGPVTPESPKTFLQRRGGMREDVKDVFGRTLEIGKSEIDEHIKATREGNVLEDVELANSRSYLKNSFVNFDKQRVLVADEYSNILKQKPQDYLNKVGYDNKDLANIYVKNNTDDLVDDKAFWDSVIKDREILSGDKVTFTLDDLTDPQHFIETNKKYINSDGKIKEDLSTDDWMNLRELNDFEVIMETNNLSIEKLNDILDNVEPIITIEDAMFNNATSNIDDLTELALQEVEKSKIRYNDATKDIISKITKTTNEYTNDIHMLNRLDFCLHKEKLYEDLGKLYKTRFKKRRGSGEIIELNEGVTDADINKFFENNNFSSSSDDNKTRLFYFLGDLQRTTNNAYGTPEYIPFYRLADKYFKSPEDMVNFLSGLNDGEYLKNNSVLLRDIFEGQTKDISMLDNFGTTSTVRIKNKSKKYLDPSYIESIDKEIVSNERMKAIRAIHGDFIKMVDNGLGSSSNTSVNLAIRASGLLRKGLSRGVMWASGINEFATNPALAAIRASRYGHNPLGALSYGGARFFKRVAKSTPSNLPNQKYVIGKLEHNLKIRNSSNPMGIEALDNSILGYKIQQMSDINLNSYGEIFATSMIDKLPESLTDVNPELARILSINGVNSKNYTAFREFSISHIRDNENYIDSKQLLDINSPESRQLRGVFNYISDDIGNIKSNSIFHTQAQNEVSKWLLMYRSFARAMSMDTLNGALYYTTKEGIRKSRFSQGGLQSTIQQVPNALTTIALIYATGKAGSMIKDLTYGDRDMAERLALAETEITNLTNKYNEEEFSDFMLYVGSDILNEVQETTGLDLGMLESEAPILSSGRKVYNWYNSESDNKTKEAIKLFAKELISKRIVETGQSLYDTYSMNWDKSKKIWGYSTEENQEYYSKVFDWRNKLSKREINDTIDIMRNKATSYKSRADYLDDNNDSYDSLPDKVKRYLNTAINVSGKRNIDIEATKRGYAVAYSDSKFQGVNAINDFIREELDITTNDIDTHIATEQETYFEPSDMRGDYKLRNTDAETNIIKQALYSLSGAVGLVANSSSVRAFSKMQLGERNILFNTLVKDKPAREEIAIAMVNARIEGNKTFGYDDYRDGNRIDEIKPITNMATGARSANNKVKYKAGIKSILGDKQLDTMATVGQGAIIKRDGVIYLGDAYNFNKDTVDKVTGLSTQGFNEYELIPIMKADKFEDLVNGKYSFEDIKDLLFSDKEVLAMKKTKVNPLEVEFNSRRIEVEEEEEVEVKEVEEKGFNSLSKAKKKYYKQLIYYLGQKDTPENQKIFYESLGNAKAKDVKSILKNKYNVDINKFYKKINVK